VTVGFLSRANTTSSGPAAATSLYVITLRWDGRGGLCSLAVKRPDEDSGTAS